ncbi:hypothetical protein [Kribbella sp. NPDC023855]|uniref:hypothetical protein n=1 Tax=Kribbella sp. NPDC023855 TaxID=3154698 RepID=UPI0033E8771D
MISSSKVRTRAIALLAAGAAAASTALLAPTAAQAGTQTTQTQTAAVSSVLLPGQYLKAGQYRRSQNGVYTLIMQTDGNAVLYKGRTALWSTQTNRKASSLVMQRDGNLVVISGRTPVWSSGTHGSTNAFLAVQNDSNLVIYNVRKKPVWHRNMVISSLYGGRALKAGQALYSYNRVYRLQMQTDGNLVLVRGNKPLWSTRTISKGAFAVMQTDGNFVVYSAAKKPLWHSKTTRRGAVLVMQNDGNLVIIHGRTPIWATGTTGR